MNARKVPLLWIFGALALLLWLTIAPALIPAADGNSAGWQHVAEHTAYASFGFGITCGACWGAAIALRWKRTT